MIEDIYISQVIFRYASILGKLSNKDATLETIANMARDLVRADRCTIWILNAERDEIVTRIAQDSVEIRLNLTEGLAGKCIRTGRNILSNSPTEDATFYSRVDRESGYITTSVLVVPMRRSDGTVMGAFQALNKVGGFSERDVELLGLAASFSVAVVENQDLLKQAEVARQIQRDLEIAREVQRNMLPKNELMDTRDLDIWACCRPASAVGGDFYDVLCGSNLSVISVGDISGKGIGAALMMASQQSTIRILAPRMAQSPALLCAELNRVIFASSSPERYSTLFFAAYDTSSRTLDYCNAGHVFPYVVHSSGNVTQLTCGGPPIGLLPAAKFQSAKVPFRSGDMLLCYSDGLSECQDKNGKMWQDVYLPMILEDVRNLSPRSCVERLMTAADEFSAGCPQFDDITLVCVRPVANQR